MNDSEDFFITVKEPFSDHPKLEIKAGQAESPNTTIKSDSKTFAGII